MNKRYLWPICLASFSLFAAEAEDHMNFPVVPEQNLFVGDSAKPQEKGAIQTKTETKISATHPGAIEFSLTGEYGVTNRFWLGPKVSYGLAHGEKGSDHKWNAGIDLGYNLIERNRFLLSLLSDISYGSDELAIKPTLALFKSVANLGINLIGGVEIRPLGKKVEIGQELSLSLFTNVKTVSPIVELLLEIEDQKVSPSITPGLIFVAIPNIEIGVAAQLHLPDPRKDSSILLSFLAEFGS